MAYIMDKLAAHHSVHRTVYKLPVPVGTVTTTGPLPVPGTGTGTGPDLCSQCLFAIFCI
jgi:hypothetical protein